MDYTDKVFDLVFSNQKSIIEDQGLRSDLYRITSVYEEDGGKCYTIHIEPKDGRSYFEAMFTPSDLLFIVNRSAA